MKRDRSRSLLVVHVINDLSPGGSERQLTQLTRHSGLRHEIVELASLGASTAATLVQLRRRLALLQPAVVAAWLERPQLAVALVRGGAAARVACIRGFPQPRPPAEQWLYRWALARYDALVANSACLRDAVEAFARPFALRPFHVIPNGVEGTPAAGGERPLARPLRIGFLGRGTFDRDKGLDVLLEALALTQAREVSAVLVGKGVPDSVAAFDGVAGRCTALPALEDPWAELAEVDALVVPSRSEGSPNVVLEAFARGVPVVATAAGGAVELLSRDRGLLVPVQDPHALAAALRELARDPAAARRRAEAARVYVSRSHAWPRIAAAFDALFLRLASAGDRGEIRPAGAIPFLRWS